MKYPDGFESDPHTVEVDGDVRHIDDIAPQTPEALVDDDYRFANEIDGGIERSPLFQEAITKIEAAIKLAIENGYHSVKVDGMVVAKYIVDIRVKRDLSIDEFNRLVELYCIGDLLEASRRTLGAAAATSAADAWSPSSILGPNPTPTIVDSAMLAANDRPDLED